jgi:hypothetical protein
MTKKGQSMQERNDRLIKLATSEALGVPSVQEECLRHLAYGLSNEQQAEFLSLISNQNIPIELRKKFFSMLIEMKRPDELIRWLCKSISSQQERELLDEARAKIQNFEEYLEPVRKELVFEAGHFTCSPFFRTSPNNYGFCLLCLLSAQKNHIFERELAQLEFFYDF